MEGQPIGVFVGYNFLGIDPTTGKEVYEDITGDGVITADDRKITGNPNPDFTLGLTNTFGYKGFDFSFFLHAIYGNDVFNGTRIYLEGPTDLDNQTVTSLTRWTKPGDVTDVPNIGDGLKSSRFIENGSFLRIKNVTLGYTVPKNVLKHIWLKSARVYVSGQNLYMFTAYSGMDPEVNYASTDNVVMGTDFFTYPQSRTILVGLNIGF
jgi:TonB-dependent starch-binding outer membrane protein SusC